MRTCFWTIIAELFAFCFCKTWGARSSWEEWWTYDGISGPDYWGLLNPEWSLCNKGRRQSPVDIDPSTLLFDPHLGPLQIDKKGVSGTIFNTGRGILFRADVLPPTPAVNITGGPLSYRYRFYEIHLHFGRENEKGSEHTISGHAFPAEVYGYNSQLYRNMSEAMHKVQGVIGIGVMLQLGEYQPPNFKEFIDHFTKVVYKGQNITVKQLSLRDLLPVSDHYMTYEGSITMPGCYETVTWIVLNKPLYITKHQLEALRHLMQGEERNPKASLGDSFRPTLPLHRRSIRTNISTKHKEAKMKACLLDKQVFYKANTWNWRV